MGYLVETSGRVLLPQELERQALTVLEVRMGGLQGWFDADDVHVDTLEELAQFAATSVRRDGDWLVLSTDTDGDPKWSEQASEFYRSLGSFVREGEVHVRGEDGQAWSYVYSGGAVTQRGDNGWDGTPGSALAPEAPAGSVPPAPSAPPAPPAAPSPPGGEDLGPAPSQFRYPGSEDRPEPPPPPAPAPYGPGAQAPTGPPPGPPLQQGPGVPDYRADHAWADPPPASGGRTLLMATLLVVGVVLIIGLALLVSGL